MKAPCVGYFDSRGKWHLITNLTEHPEDPRRGKSAYTELSETPKRQPIGKLEWLPKKSSEVFDVSYGISAGTP